VYRRVNGAWVDDNAGSSSSLRGVWVAPTGRVFAVGWDGSVRIKNGSWSNTTLSGVNHLMAVSGVDENDVWAVSNNGSVAHYTAGSWTVESAVHTNDLSGVWCGSANHVVAVGYNTIKTWDGSAWSTYTPPSHETYYSVWGAAPNDIFAVGNLGVLRHFDGNAWTLMDSGTTQTLQAVFGTSGADVFAVGYGGTILRYDGAGWSPVRSNGKSYRGVWGAAGEVMVFVGDQTIEELSYPGPL